MDITKDAVRRASDEIALWRSCCGWRVSSPTGESVDYDTYHEARRERTKAVAVRAIVLSNKGDSLEYARAVVQTAIDKGYSKLGSILAYARREG